MKTVGLTPAWKQFIESNLNPGYIFPKADLNCLLCRDGKGRHPYSLSSGCPLPQPFPPLLGSRLSEMKLLLFIATAIGYENSVLWEGL